MNSASKKTARATYNQLLTALVDCHDAMEMQLKRESGEFHIDGPTARYIWDNAMRRAREAIGAERE